ncbi:MAG: diaminopimelate epimerase [Bacteroidales bacterium]
MKIEFYKYHGAGNDFILIDDRTNNHQVLDSDKISFLCHRRFGIGADGLMFLKSIAGYHFNMEYYNSDGRIGTMCGNGGRCITAFARDLGILDQKASFMASDGLHESFIDSSGLISLKMKDVDNIIIEDDYYFLDTGSPHYVTFVEDINKTNVYQEGKRIRNSDVFKPAGTNVNFVSLKNDNLFIRTYERGVEDETYACGTGSVASAIAFALKFKINQKKVQLNTLGGVLEVSFERENLKFSDIYLKGPAKFVFKGIIEI